MDEGRYVVVPPRYFTAGGAGIDLAMLRRPRASAVARQRLFALPPTSRIRQRLFGRLFTLIFRTYQERDFSTAPSLFFASDCELRAANATRVDLPALAVGTEEIIRWLELWHEPFSHVRWRPVELFDGGDVAYMGIEMTAIGRASRAEVRNTMYSSVWFENGFVVSQSTTMDRDEALVAAGFA